MSEEHLIESLPPVVAAGVAARAALSLHHTRNTTTGNKVENEELMRAQLIQDAREHYQLGDAEDESTLEKIVHALYEYSDHLLNRVEETITGLFTVDSSVNKNTILTRRIRRENKIISKTVAYPTKVYKEFIGQKGGILRFECIYVREIQGENPFFEIVVARQASNSVHVSQCLRLYPNVNRPVSLPEAQLHLLLKTLGDKVSADALAAVLQSNLPESTIIVIYSAHWVFSYYSGGTTNPIRDLAILFQDPYLDGFAAVSQ